MAQLLSSLPIGAKVKFGKYQVGSETPTPIKWTIVAKNHTGYPSDSITLHSTYAIDLLCMDAREDAGDGSGGKYAMTYGCNYYKYSNIDQWLNSDANAGQWFSPTHNGDAAPSSGTLYVEGLGTAYRVMNKATYSNRSGFLNLFSAAEKAAILSTPIVCVKPYYMTGFSLVYETINRKVFLPSATERMGYTGYGKEGTEWEGADYTNNPRVTPEVVANTTCSIKPSTTSDIKTWTRTPYNTGTNNIKNAYFSYDNGYGISNEAYEPCVSGSGIRPVVNVSANTGVSDTTDSDGYYTMFLNTTPTTPSFITIPTTVYGGKAIPISWGESIDDDGNFGGYILERQTDGGNWVEIYRGVTASYTDSFPLIPPVTTVAYRVRAYDIISNAPYSYSSYKTSSTYNVVNNYEPVIHIETHNLGVKTDEFSTWYSVVDANGTSPIVTIRLDNEVIFNGEVKNGVNHDIYITDSRWLRLSNGTHTITIAATDGIDTNTSTISFTKSVSTLSIINSSSLPSETQPGRIRVSVTRKIPEGAIFKVFVCNNGDDDVPTWEDMTYEVENNDVYVFTNNTKTASTWGIKIKVEVDRNGAEGECYISQIGGNFE